MTRHYGRVDPKKMPDQDTMRKWEGEARRAYQPSSGLSYERFKDDYVWNKIADWQEDQRGEE